MDIPIHCAVARAQRLRQGLTATGALLDAEARLGMAGQGVEPALGGLLHFLLVAAEAGAGHLLTVEHRQQLPRRAGLDYPLGQGVSIA